LVLQDAVGGDGRLDRARVVMKTVKGISAETRYPSSERYRSIPLFPSSYRFLPLSARRSPVRIWSELPKVIAGQDVFPGLLFCVVVMKW
jgi:hypothetical protein